ncbi:MAG: hypothetical protein LBP51_00605 [Deferribacteraceae bacterium]|jgi:hypothetical protein|nr:hypothetical protein [Deferribacteraceae bacterium]
MDIKISTAYSIILGVSGTGRYIISDRVWLLAAAKLGISFNYLEAEAEYLGYSYSESTSGNALAGSLEAGVVFPFNRWDFGFILKYTMIEQEVENAENTDLGGFSALFSIAFNF